MTKEQQTVLYGALTMLFIDRPKMKVTDWCLENLRFDEPDNHGPFSLIGREYIREPLDNFGDPRITDEADVFGTQTGKTSMFMGGTAWAIVNEPARILWAMPSIELARSFSRTRWIPMIRSSPLLSVMIPTGSRRFEFKSLEQNIGGSIVNFVGSNSPANLSSHPARIVNLDEVDKFDSGGGKEADALNLAEQRTKKFSNPKRHKTSSPTLTDGIIWQEFLKGDQRRYFIPCPSCQKQVVLVWAKEYTVFPLTGNEAVIGWDQEAKTEKGWDYERVEKSAHALCPHCATKIRNDQKTIMVRHGKWSSTVSAPAHFRSYHLSSLYASSVETSWGKLAVKFLQAKSGLLGIQGFINGDLAEPWENQENRSERIEVIAGPESQPIEGAVSFMTVDFQLKSPHFWYVIRSWNKDSRLINYGSCDRWEEIRQIQLENNVSDNHVGIDSGHRAEEVYGECLRFGKLLPRPGSIPLHVGWTPMKGFERRDQWRDKKTGQPQPYLLSSAALPHKKFRLPLLEFSDDHLKDMLTRLRRKKTKFRWEICSDVTEEYFKHLDGEYKKSIFNPKTHRVSEEWVKRSKSWPNHLFDCEVMQVAMALMHKKLPWNES